MLRSATTKVRCSKIRVDVSNGITIHPWRYKPSMALSCREGGAVTSYIMTGYANENQLLHSQLSPHGLAYYQPLSCKALSFALLIHRNNVSSKIAPPDSVVLMRSPRSSTITVNVTSIRGSSNAVGSERTCDLGVECQCIITRR